MLGMATRTVTVVAIFALGCTSRKLPEDASTAMDGTAPVDAPAGGSGGGSGARGGSGGAGGRGGGAGGIGGDSGGRDGDGGSDDGRITLDAPMCGTRSGQYGLDFLAGPNGCPAKLQDIQSRCADSRVQRIACRDYVQVEFSPPALDPTRTQYRSTCFYATDTMALTGGMIVVAGGEDPPAMTAGAIPLPCNQPCASVELVCDPAADAGGPG
jgi:hypothetical protein